MPYKRDGLAVVNVGACPPQDLQRAIALEESALKPDDLKDRLRPREIAHHFGHAASARLRRAVQQFESHFSSSRPFRVWGAIRRLIRNARHPRDRGAPLAAPDKG